MHWKFEKWKHELLKMMLKPGVKVCLIVHHTPSEASVVCLLLIFQISSKI
jgi:hypothetical protein